MDKINNFIRNKEYNNNSIYDDKALTYCLNNDVSTVNTNIKNTIVNKKDVSNEANRKKKVIVWNWDDDDEFIIPNL